MKIGLVVGQFPRGQCGVGDYVDLLAEALRARDIEAHVVDSGDWRLLKSREVYRSLQNQNFDLVQIHYPALGFGSKFGPQMLSLLRRCVICLHEGSQAHPLRRLAMLPFSVRPWHVIFFSNFERDFGVKRVPWISGISSVIPPPSNIRKIHYDGPRDLQEVVSFGLIRPGNGHNALLEFAALLKASALPLCLRVVGSPQSSKFVPYFEELRRRADGLPIIWDHGLSEQQVADRLARASLAYLPYPGGAAELRSTLKAALLNGLAIVTTRGRQTPSNLHGVVRFCGNPEEALAEIRFLLENPAERASMAERASQYVKNWTWERTAELHAEIYERVLGHTAPQSELEVARLTGKRSLM